MSDKYTEAEETIEAVRERIDRSGATRIAQVDALLIVAEMLVDIARTLGEMQGIGVSVEISNPNDLVRG